MKAISITYNQLTLSTNGTVAFKGRMTLVYIS